MPAFLSGNPLIDADRSLTRIPRGGVRAPPPAAQYADHRGRPPDVRGDPASRRRARGRVDEREAVAHADVRSSRLPAARAAAGRARLADYEFVTTWTIDAPIDTVWDAILDSERWPEWWKGAKDVVALQAGDADGVGDVRRYNFRSRLPYDLVFDIRTTRVEAPHALDGAASGELVGEGRWRLRATDAGTVVRYEWDVSTTRRWMNWLTPIARPFFRWNHNVVMRWGEEGLRRHLSAEGGGSE